MQRNFQWLGIFLLSITFHLVASEPVTGPVIENFGPVFKVPEDSLNLDPSQTYKIVMDIAKGQDDPGALNRGIETAARFLNMHARNGIKPENLNLALVLHGSGIHAALNDENYDEKFLVNNANRPLITALKKAGVDIYVCGQSAAYNGYTSAQFLSEIDMAVSAMTVHIRLQQDGYQPILF